MSAKFLQCFGECNCKGQNTKRVQIAETAFQSLSPEEQDCVYGDLYGTEEPIEESPEFLNKKLAELDKELALLREGITKHFDRAVNMEKNNGAAAGGNKNEYVTKPEFRLMFLRAERFDARKAATRLAKYFTEKLELFGEDKLASKIKQEDFNDYVDNHALPTGGISYTGARDKAGRSIVMCRLEQIFSENIMSMKRVFFYTIQRVVEENETSQKQGVVIIAYNMYGISFGSPSDVIVFFPIFRMVNNALPFRPAAVHHCYNDYKDHFILNLGLVVHPKDIRARFRLHFQETHLECMLNLSPYGIVPNSLPLTDEGHFCHEALWEQLQRWQRQE